MHVEVKRHIQSAAVLVGGAGILLAVLLSSWAAARFTRPVEDLAAAAREVAAGNLRARVDSNFDRRNWRSRRSFQSHDAGPVGTKERLIQSERVAAWRELARRLAHELKNPLFPLQLTVEEPGEGSGTES